MPWNDKVRKDPFSESAMNSLDAGIVVYIWRLLVAIRYVMYLSHRFEQSIIVATNTVGA